MKILLLTPQLPWPPHQGTAMRNYNLIRHLAARHTVDLITFFAPDERLDADNPLHALCGRVDALPQPHRTSQQRLRDTLVSSLPDMALRLADPAMDALLASRLQSETYDVVQAEGIEMARYGLQAAKAGQKFVFDDHNCEYLLQKRNALTDLRRPARLPAALYSLVQWQKLRRYEATACTLAHAVAAVSEADAAALQTIAPAARIATVANGIDLDFYTPHAPGAASQQAGRTLVFTGKMDYRPNIDAVLWFAQNVLPLVRRSAPDVTFRIVGRNPHARLNTLRDNPAVTIVGAVEDIRPDIHGGDVYVIPLRVGGGTRFKALEAMACARPIVSTSLGVEGIGATHDRDLLLADTPSNFAAAVLRLLAPGNGPLRAQLGANARTFVEAHYGWEPIVRRLEPLYSAQPAPTLPA